MHLIFLRKHLIERVRDSLPVDGSPRSPQSLWRHRCMIVLYLDGGAICVELSSTKRIAQ